MASSSETASPSIQALAMFLRQITLSVGGSHRINSLIICFFSDLISLPYNFLTGVKFPFPSLSYESTDYPGHSAIDPARAVLSLGDPSTLTTHSD